MSEYNVDLTNCNREPIHVPGKIQSQGFLVGINTHTFTITYVSENIDEFTGFSANSFLNQPITKLEEDLKLQDLLGSLKQLLKLGQTQNFDTINPLRVNIGSRNYHLVISLSENTYLLEFEPILIQYDIQSAIGSSVSEILGGKKLKSLLESAAFEVKKLIEYDRVMIYKFANDGHGEVVAEVKNEELEPFLGLHYPATDIPKPARELYKLNYTRLIADVYAEDSAIISLSENGALDLTHSQLRAVSPIHIQYLKNMKVDSSFSISILAHGELWGLIACHNYSPKFIDYKARAGSKLIGQILSSAIEYRQDEEDNEKTLTFKSALTEITSYLSQDISLTEALIKKKHTIQEVTHAGGAAVIFEGEITTVGNTPTAAQIKDLIEWLTLSVKDSLFHTNKLPEIYPPANDFKAIGAGILVSIISKELKEMIIWFKPETVIKVKWAGNPDKTPVVSAFGLLEISPRTSFETWTQEVANSSELWSTEELSSAIDIREKIITAINLKASQIRLLNEQLKTAYEELDSFSYTVSHDLRSPLTAIKTYTEFLLRSNESIDENGRKILDRILAGADKMNFLIKEILKLSRVGRTDFERKDINMENLIEDIITELKMVYNITNQHLEIGELPSLKGDHTMIGQVFTNLLSNAVKYSSHNKDSKIKIEGYKEGSETIYKISDNGVGIDVNYYDRVFEVFKRMDNAVEFEGTGVGLAIVKRIVERHDGRIWFESKLKVGTIFYVAFKN